MNYKRKALEKFAKGGVKKDMNCGEVRRSTRPGKKIMKKVCKDGKEKLVHAGAKGYKNNYSKEAKKSFRARHKCSTAKDPFSARKLACEELWSKSVGVGKQKAKSMLKKAKKKK